MTLLKVTRGSDVRVQLDVSIGDQPFDLTGRAVEVFGAAQQIERRATATILDAAAGAIEVFIEGTDPLPVGTYAFRVQIAGVGDSVGLPAFNLKVV